LLAVMGKGSSGFIHFVSMSLEIIRYLLQGDCYYYLVCSLLSGSYSLALVIYCFGREFARRSFKEEHSTNIP